MTRAGRPAARSGGRAAILAGLLGLAAGCSRSAAPESTRRPITETEALRIVQQRFDLRSHYTNEFIPAPGAAPLPPLVPARKLRLGLSWIANDQVSPWFVGLEKGFFRDAGIDLEIVEGGPNRDNMTSVIAGDLDMNLAVSDLAFRVLASPTGADLVMVAATIKQPVLAWITLDPTVPRTQRSRHRVSAADLKGKRIGLQPGAFYYAEYLCDRMGIPVEDLKIVNAGATPDALEAGAMDFYQGWLDNQTRMIEHDGYANWTAVSFRDLGYRSYSDISTVTRAFFRREPDLLRHYVAALDRSLRYLLDHRDESAAIVARRTAGYGLTLADVRWRLDVDAPLYAGDGGEPLLALSQAKLETNLAQLYLYRQIDLPEKP